MTSGQSLPSGTVTFLFTDIEGSTRLVQQLGARYPDVLAAHQRILRDIFERHGGHEIDTQGDSFFVAFDRARNAVEAAIEGQRALDAHDWPEGAQVRVRMGLHSGDPIATGEGYTGMGVHRAARIAAAGHGGQVLLSSATRELVRDDVSVSLKDLGEIGLKDLPAPDHLHQLVIPGLPSEFPTLKGERRHRHRWPTVAAAAALVAALVAIAIVALGGGSGTVTVKPNSIAAIDPGSGKVVTQIPVGTDPGAITYGAGSLWVANEGDKTISRVDPKAKKVIKSLPLTDRFADLAASGGAVLVAGAVPGEQRNTVRRIDPQFNSIGEPTAVGNVVPGNGAWAAAKNGELWVAPTDGLLTRLSADGARIERTIDPQTQVSGIALGAGAVWLSGGNANTITRVDSTGLVTAIGVGNRPLGIAVGAGSVWAAENLDNAVVRIDPQQIAVRNTIPVGDSPGSVAVGLGSVWVANSGDGTVSRIDPKTGKVAQTIKLGASPHVVTIAGGKVWVTVGELEAQTEAAVQRGTLRLVAQDGPGSTDPALNYSKTGWQLLEATCAKLLNYPDKQAPVGSQLQAEAATSLPKVTNGGKTYTFTIRKGFRFSPPSNQPVTAETFRYTIERTLNPRMKGPMAQSGYFDKIRGFGAFEQRRARHLAGVKAAGDKLTIELTEPAPDFPSRLAMQFFCAIPVGTPIDPGGIDLDSMPMAGPYYGRPGPGGPLVLVRNPNYRGARPARIPRIQLTTDVSRRKGAGMVEQGKADYQVDGLPAADLARLRSRYGQAAPGKARLMATPSLSISFLMMNTARAVFRDPALRQAVNYAIDRTAFAQLGAPDNPVPDKPADQYLPPGIPGFHEAGVYPLHADLDKAKQLAGGKRRRATAYICSGPPVCDKQAQLLKTQLEPIGIELDIKRYSGNELFDRLGRPGEPYDIVFNGWLADYPDPANFIDALLGNVLPFMPRFTDPRFVGRLHRAALLSGPERYLTYGKLDAELARESAPFAVFGNSVSYDFFSSRVGCQVYQPAFAIDLAALCLKGK